MQNSQIHFLKRLNEKLDLAFQTVKYQVVCLKWLYPILDQDILMTSSLNSWQSPLTRNLVYVSSCWNNLKPFFKIHSKIENSIYSLIALLVLSLTNEKWVFFCVCANTNGFELQLNFFHTRYFQVMMKFWARVCDTLLTHLRHMDALRLAEGPRDLKSVHFPSTPLWLEFQMWPGFLQADVPVWD